MPGQQKKTSKSHSLPQLRLIGGTWRGRVLRFPDADGLRPTGNRIRETLFNWLMPVLSGSRCLDVFAGSGALGLEALSRGAQSCMFLEKHVGASVCLHDNLQLLGCRNAQVTNIDALAYLVNHPTGEPFNVVFLDPPFSKNLWQDAVDELERRWLQDYAHIYVETPAHSMQAMLRVPANWQLHRQKTAGKVIYSLYIRRETCG